MPDDNEQLLSDYQPVKNFLLLYFGSLGVYQFFWTYRHWRYLQENRQPSISPGFRTLFAVFYSYSLFATFRKLAKEKGRKGYWPPLLLYLVYAGLALCGLFFKDSIFSLLALLSFLPLLPVLRDMNAYYLAQYPERRLQTGLGADEKVFLLIFWGLLLVYFFMG